LEFVLPLRVTHLLHTSYKRKFVQILLVGCVETSLELSHPTLESASANVSFLNMFSNDQTFIVRKDQSVSFAWELQTNDSVNDVLVPCTFQLHYQVPGVTTVPQKQHYSFTLENFTTLFLVTSALIPNDDDHQSQSSSLEIGKSYNVRLAAIPAIPEASATSYEVTFNEKDWSVTGKTTGDVVVENGLFQVTVSACPLKSGYLYLPSIRLLRQTTVAPKDERGGHGASGENSSSSDTTSSDHLTIETDSGQVSAGAGNASPVEISPETVSVDISPATVSVDISPVEISPEIISVYISPQTSSVEISPSDVLPNKGNDEYKLVAFDRNQIYDCTERQQIRVGSKDDRKLIASPVSAHATEITL
jgi:hypothetical protein